MTKEITVLEQCHEWVKGNSIHLKIKDVCCPDFSCCNKNVNTPIEVRERFLKAFIEEDEPVIYEMLMMFLGNAFSAESIHIAGDSHKGLDS